MSKGELVLYDQEFADLLTPDTIRAVILLKLQTEISTVRNMFPQSNNYSFEISELEQSERQYTKIKNEIKNPIALKKLNDLVLTEHVRT